MKDLNVKLKNYEVTFQEDNVYFEHNELGEDGGVKIWFNKNKEIFDYETPLFDMPKEVSSFMTLLGFRSM